MALKNEYAGTYTEEGLVGLRHNLSMYVDSTNATADGKAPVGLTQLAQELISNTTDEYLNGYGHEVKIVIHPDNSMTISDHGRGLVRGEKDTFEDVIRNAWIPHTSGKFAEAAGYTARGTTGMHGIGLKATNAGSVYLTIHAISHSITGRNTDTTKARLDGGYDEYEITFHNISKDFDTKLIHHWTKDEVTEIEPDDPKRGSNQFKINATGEIKTTGTSITFLPDIGPISDKNQNPVFGSRNWNDNDLLPRMNAAAYLNPDFEVDFTDERYKVQNEDTGEEELFHKHYVYHHGIKDYIKVLAEGQPLISGMSKSIELDGVTDYEGLSYDLQGELLFTNDLSTTITSFANGAPTPQGGPHLDGFKRAIVKTLTDYAINAKAIKSAKEFDDNDILEGITAVFEIRTPMSVAKFDGQTKGRFATDQAKPVTQEIVARALNNWLYAHQKQADALVNQMKDAQKLRQDLLKKKQDQKAANKAKNNNSTFISPKLKEASGKNPEDLELYLTEGDSASNIGRDPKTQAVFPLRGNIKNAMDISLSTALQNDEISTIQNVIGAGIGPSFDVSDMRYGKIIMACFPADTRVMLLNGEAPSIKEMADSPNKEFDVYSTTDTGEMRPGKARNVRKIGTTKELIQITLDDGQIIRSTPDHFFMNRHGQMEMASDLTKGTSLMPLYLKQADRNVIWDVDRQMFKDNTDGKWKMVHQRVYASKDDTYDDAKPPKGYHVHHINQNYLDNRPSNLKLLTAYDHLSLHAKLNTLSGVVNFATGWTNYNKSEKHRNRVHDLWQQGHYDAYTWTRYNKSPKHSQQVKQAWKDGKYDNVKGWTDFNKSEKHRKRTAEVNVDPIKQKQIRRNRIIMSLKFMIINEIPIDEENWNIYKKINTVPWDRISDYFDSFDELLAYVQANLEQINLKNYRAQFEGKYSKFRENVEKMKAGLNYNHKIVEIRHLYYDKPIDVYCMDVDKYHNFAVTQNNKSGIFVKNCDADTDGGHIRSLLIALFYQYFPGLIQAGKLYAIEPPLYKATKYINGKADIHQFYSEAEIDAARDQLKGYDIQRYKGLGEMDEKEAHDAIVDPKSRRLLKITINDAEQASRTLRVLLGSDAKPRKKWLEKSIDFDALYEAANDDAGDE